MKIKKSQRFRNELKKIVKYVARDSNNRAYKFKDDLISSIDKQLDYMPYKFRQSNTSSDTNVRDFIFKGYIIPYFIDNEKDTIIILGIYKENIWQ